MSIKMILNHIKCFVKLREMLHFIINETENENVIKPNKYIFQFEITLLENI